jgi:hypothetical protein
MRYSALVILVGLMFLPGCRRGIDPDADQGTADSALRTAMEAWKSGKSQADLENGSPSIIFNEDDLRVGKQLIDFKMESSTMRGRQVHCGVRLSLKEKDGKEVERKAVYIIDTTPRIVIVRDSFAKS